MGWWARFKQVAIKKLQTLSFDHGSITQLLSRYVVWKYFHMRRGCESFNIVTYQIEHHCFTYSLTCTVSFVGRVKILFWQVYQPVYQQVLAYQCIEQTSESMGLFWAVKIKSYHNSSPFIQPSRIRVPGGAGLRIGVGGGNAPGKLRPLMSCKNQI